MRRRHFIAGAAAAALLRPVTARAAPRPRLAFLDLGSEDRSLWAALGDGLAALGYVEGKTIDVDRRYADGDVARLAALTRDLLQSHPDVIVASAPSGVIAARDAAPTLPIVCPLFSDTLVPKMAASFAHPGGTVTGIANLVEEIYGKLVALARDAIPGITRLGLLLNPTSPIAPGARAQVTAAASATGLALTIAEAATREELEAALTALAATQALVVSPNGFFVAQAPRLYAWQMAARVPLIAATRGNGEMVNYGVDPAENFRRAATYVDKILKGARPGDLPIEFPTKVLLEVNLKVAKALGLAIPPQLLARADEVIE